ncbi:unnamed protein product [Angiostrongylus costaricensis]|uniref:Intraflagellar transport protein 74 homolog n=1 Tax=Angiostrongylus costaricensis TaxID=334426 RepID=A0A158PLL2_ANGCS|nr:unnamed protein product [Angiostrongylus costaricensis]
MIGERPMTGIARPPSVGVNPIIRPVTQQGLSGGRAVSRLRTGSMRQVHDKSYYMGVLRVKMNQLTAEIAHLEEIYQKGERDRSELDAYEQRARKSATELKELQGKLIDYNVLVDRMHMNHEMNEIEAEARREKEIADDVNGWSDLRMITLAREIEIEEIATEIDEQKRLNQAILAGMDPSIREHYEDAKEQCEALRAEVEEMEEELNNLNERKDQLEKTFLIFTVQMRRNLDDLQVKEAALLAEKEAQETPEQKKQKLIEEIKTNNEQISTMEKQIFSLQRLNMLALVGTKQRGPLFIEFNDKFPAKNSEKYRELMIKEREYDEFLEGYEHQKQTLNKELEAYTDDIVRLLQKISANIMKLESANATSNIVDRDELLLLQENASPTELQNLHVRLQEEMMLLEENETRLKSEIATLERRLGELSEEYASYSDLDKISVRAEKNIQKLEQRRDELESVLPEHEAHCERLRVRLRELTEKLENNPRYATQKNLMRKLEMLKESNARLRAEVEARESETNYEPIKAEVRRLRTQYNEYLVNTIGRK